MSKEQHTGKLAERKIGFRKPDLGYYFIVTNAVETEPNFLNGIKKSLPNNVQGRLVIKVKSTKTYDMVEMIVYEMNKSPIFYDPWIVFDKDQIPDFDKLISKAEKNSINVGWSNPCIEIFFLSYLGKNPNVSDQTDCINKFCSEYKRVMGKEYKKNNENIYDELSKNGDESKAVKIHENKHNEYLVNDETQPSKMVGLSTLYKLVKEINIKKNSE